MLIKNPEFKISAVSPTQYPQDCLPEIVLVGKSNVGKSSFINTMVNRKKLARTSIRLYFVFANKRKRKWNKINISYIL